ncbi:hypothetical protein [Corallococcus llansteffanensis]|uniref:Tetratricopeptide repeat protein n=1 Tax=Corallococcus llansteffanensis TaxID=2316731 RepID=A0A3A8PIP0_9BACT|nr:hypothetical protein [Corallococcus llansteffanensis]RKH55180.1 hypothetical protein D7V93_23615 [Corallococcus llansteffanensis]
MLSLLTVLVLTAAPADFDALRARALAAYEARDDRRARALYTQAARLRPEHAAVQSDLGLCLMKQGRTPPPQYFLRHLSGG